MSANRHLADAVSQAVTLDGEISVLIDMARAGHRIGLDELSHIRRTVRYVLTHAALAKVEAQRDHESQPERTVKLDPECTQYIAEWKADIEAKACDCRGLCDGVTVDGINTQGQRCVLPKEL